MTPRILGTALLTLFLSTQALDAQQPGRPAPRDSMGGGMTMRMDGPDQMRVMDSMNARLDTLLGRMNRASGNAKVPAMAQVINELVAQRRVMQKHMHQMMRSGGGMMRGRMMRETNADSARTRPGKPEQRDRGHEADTSGQAEHHPEK